MQTYKVTCHVKIPIRATDQEITDWIGYHFHRVASLSQGNPLYRYEPESELEPFHCVCIDNPVD